MSCSRTYHTPLSSPTFLIPILKSSLSLIVILIFFFLPQSAYPSEIFSVQAGALSSKRNAENLVKTLKKQGIKCNVQEVEGLNKVYCGKFSQKPDALALKRKLSALGYKDAFIVSRTYKPLTPLAKQPEVAPSPPLKEKAVERPLQKVTEPTKKEMPIVQKKPPQKDITLVQEEVTKPKDIPIAQERVKKPVEKEIPPVQEKFPPRDVAMIQEEVTKPKEVPFTEEGITGDIFERWGGYLHPFLSIAGHYTDNVFNTKDDKKYDYIAIISPGIWISAPRIRQRLAGIETSTVSPGGFSLSRVSPEFFRRYQLYTLYRADIEQFSKYSSENFINHLAEGVFQYNFRGGLSIEFADQFVKSHDIRGTGISKELDEYATNIINLIIAYDLSEKFKLRADYSHFLVDYDASRNKFRDRIDNSVAGYVFYKFFPKTAAFVQYKFITIDYDKSTLSNSNEQHFLGGLQWDITAKSRGNIRTGYGIKNFTGSDLGRNKEFIMEAEIDHTFTPKTSIRLMGSRRTNETNISTTDFIISDSVGLEYRQRLTSKISGSLKFAFVLDTYKGDVTFGGVTKQRQDNLYSAGVALQYELKEWLKIDTGYMCNRRDSNFADFDYTNNVVFFRIAGSL